tara:strand:- start:780 stop:1148 length:369 start_codon:yes stop_codon:yes gene_type:complete
MTDQATQTPDHSTLPFSPEQLKLLMESGIPIDNLVEGDTPGITDKEYLELAEHAKSIVEIAQLQSEKLKTENMELKKILISTYGFIRVLDDQYDLLMPPEFSYTFELIRGYVSEYIETKIFS